jgi:hypothetical protein
MQDNKSSAFHVTGQSTPSDLTQIIYPSILVYTNLYGCAFRDGYDDWN